MVDWAVRRTSTMPRALIVHASRHGGTAGIAEKIGETLRAEGIDAVVSPASHAPDPRAFDACIVGGGVYMGSWLKDGTDYLERYEPALATIPTWLFSSGPLKGASVKADPADLYGGALGPADGTGSGGRKKIEALIAAIHAREHRLFFGAFDPNDPPKAMSERFVRLMPAFKGILPAGDFREWDVIAAWAHEIAAAIKEPVAVA
jgi:menaquinone-dependent protoporphyrinogen oxidase